MSLETIKKGICMLSVEDIVTIKGKNELLLCEFCDRYAEHEVEMYIGGRKTAVWLCGHCPESKGILAELKYGDDL